MILRSVSGATLYISGVIRYDQHWYEYSPETSSRLHQAYIASMRSLHTGSIYVAQPHRNKHRRQARLRVLTMTAEFLECMYEAPCLLVPLTCHVMPAQQHCQLFNQNKAKCKIAVLMSRNSACLGVCLEYGRKSGTIMGLRAACHKQNSHVSGLCLLVKLQ